MSHEITICDFKNNLLQWLISCWRATARMEYVIQLQIEKLPGDLYLATSEDVQGLVAMGHSVEETLKVARDVARRLLEVQSNGSAALQPMPEKFDYPLIVAI